MKLAIVVILFSVHIFGVELRGINNSLSPISDEGNLRKLWNFQADKRAKQEALAEKVEKLLKVQDNSKVKQAKRNIEKQLEVNFLKFLSVILVATPNMTETSQENLLRVMRGTLNGHLDFKPVVNKLPELLRQDQTSRLFLLLRTIEPENATQEDLRQLSVTKQEVEENTDGDPDKDEYPNPGEETSENQFPENQGPPSGYNPNQVNQGPQQQGTNNGNQFVTKQGSGNTSGGGNKNKGNQKQQGNQNSGNKQQQQQQQGNQGSGNETTKQAVVTTTPAPNNWDAIIEAIGKIDIKEVGIFLKEIPAIFEGIQAIIDGVEEFF